MSKNPVIAALPDPLALEQQYQDDPATFITGLYAALQEQPHSPILQFWQTRIEFPRRNNGPRTNMQVQLPRLILLCLLATLLIKIPTVLPLSEVWFYTRFAPFIVIITLILYFASQQRPSLFLTRIILAIALTVLATMLLLPDNETSASIIMATVHAPLVMWSALGLGFTAANWRSATARLDYLRYNGELFIYTVLILLGGAVLSGMTIGLFSLLNLNIEQWYADNVIAIGLVSAPLVATFVFDGILQRQSRLATLIANVFTPLFLVMITIYLIAMIVQQQSPFTDRNFLILFNGLLLLVLAMTIFSIAGRDARAPSLLADGVNLGLITVTLLVNIVALSAILYRLAEWGLSPNRVVVTGANLLIFMHLITIIISYSKVLRGLSPAAELTRAITAMLPVYALWSAFVMLILPLLFWFQ